MFRFPERKPERGYIRIRGQKINANFFCTKFFESPSGHGRPRRKSWTSAPKVRFSAAPVMGRNLLTQGRPGVRVRNVRGKSGPKSLCLCCFFLPDECSPGTKSGTRVRLHAPPERKPELGYIRKNHPFTKPPFCLPVKVGFPPIPARATNKRCTKPHFLHKSAPLRTFCCSFWNWREPHFLRTFMFLLFGLCGSNRDTQVCQSN